MCESVRECEGEWLSRAPHHPVTVILRADMSSMALGACVLSVMTVRVLREQSICTTEMRAWRARREREWERRTTAKAAIKRVNKRSQRLPTVLNTHSSTVKLHERPA